MTLPTEAPQASPTTDPASTDPVPARTRVLTMGALVLGGFGVGVAEFVTMGVLPQIADGIGVDIPTAGHTISAYALGVVIGTPIAAMATARAPRRGVLVALMLIFAVGNALSATAGDYASLMASRFVAGLPHGAFFGAAALAAVAMVQRRHAGRAVGTVMLGIPLAMLVGVPLGTRAGQLVGWETVYWGVAVIGLVTALLIRVWAPAVPGEAGHSWRTELAAFANLQFVLTMLIGAVGFGGIFAMYSYVAPTVTDVTGMGQEWVPIFLLVYGLFSLVGTWLGGRLGDWSVLRTLVLTGAGSALSLLAFAGAAGMLLPALVTIAVVGLCGSAWVVALQLRLMSVAGPARTLGAAMNHSSLNLANALGAWLGGLVIAAGYGYRAPALVGAALSVGGLLVLLVSLLVHRSTAAPAR